MKRISSTILVALASLVLFSCKKNDGPSIDDYFLNYEIPEVAVTADYTVGAFYYTWGTFNANIKETPVIGKYTGGSGNVLPAIMKQQIDTASIKGGLDYFVFSVRSFRKDNGNYRNDSVTVRRFVDANTDNRMKFAIAYNFNQGSYGLTNTNPIEVTAGKLDSFCRDIEAFVPYFQNANYMKVKGKYLLYIINAHQLISNDNPAVYKTLRTRLSALGIELYIVGMQDRWTPPARYIFRYQNCVDAIYHQSFISQLGSWDRAYVLPQMIDQNWQYSRKFFKEQMGVEYIPNISPAYNWFILNPTSNNPSVARNGNTYKKFCNVAKMNASEDLRLILIDSYNKWDEDMQLEPAQSYGDLYLDITRTQFKKQ
jgi:hypothetical protein